MPSLYGAIVDPLRLRAGWRRVKAGGGMGGTDGVTVRMFELRLEAELDALATELRNRTYRPEPLLRFDVPKASGGVRALSVPAVRDRVVQSAALIALEPTIERELEAASFAYRSGRSYHDAIETLRRLRDEGFVWVVDADIESFFDRVDHDLLLERLAELVPDPDVLHLVEAWITVDARYRGRRVARAEGIPQGAPISPLLANLFLDRFDEAIAAEGHRLVRYADDFVILCRTRPRAEEALRLTEGVLGDLELRLNEEKTQITSFDAGFRFLGSLFVRSLIVSSEHELPNHDAEVAAPAEASEAAPEPPEAEPPVLPLLPGRAELERTSMGRALVRALDTEGVSVREFVEAFKPEALAAAPSAAGLLESDLDWEAAPLDPEAPPALAEGVVPMLRTLYIQEQGSWLRVEGDRLRVTVGREPRRELLDVPAIKVQHVVVFGNCLITPAAMRYLLYREVPITLLSTRGRYYGRVEPAETSDVTRQRAQFLLTMDPAMRLGLGRQFVRGKLYNLRSLLRRHARRRGSGPDDVGAAVAEAAQALSRALRQAEQADTLEQVLGHEGRATAVYFGVFDDLLAGTDFRFDGRNRRPPRDPVNAMLSFGYTLLFSNLYAMVRRHRLSPYAGFLHAERAGHPALVSDLIEEFRFLIDRMVLALCKRRTLTPEAFEYAAPRVEGGARACLLTEEARKTFIRAFEQTMHRQVTHPGTGFTVTYRRCLDLQVRALVRHLAGEEPYAPFKII